MLLVNFFFFRNCEKDVERLYRVRQSGVDYVPFRSVLAKRAYCFGSEGKDLGSSPEVENLGSLEMFERDSSTGLGKTFAPCHSDRNPNCGRDSLSAFCSRSTLREPARCGGMGVGQDTAGPEVSRKSTFPWLCSPGGALRDSR